MAGSSIREDAQQRRDDAIHMGWMPSKRSAHEPADLEALGRERREAFAQAKAKLADAEKTRAKLQGAANATCARAAAASRAHNTASLELETVIATTSMPWHWRLRRKDSRRQRILSTVPAAKRLNEAQRDAAKRCYESKVAHKRAQKLAEAADQEVRRAEEHLEYVRPRLGGPLSARPV
jgi:hypothetical protein